MGYDRGMNLNLRQLSLWLAGSWLLVASLLMTLSFFHLLYPPFFLFIFLPIWFMELIILKILTRVSQLPKEEIALVATLGAVWLLHATGLVVPETGFDAVWYHLPVAQSIVAARGLVVLPDLYQSLNPLFSDLLFVAGFGLGKELGAKVVAYTLTLSLVLVSYQLARVKLSRFWSLWLALIVSTFQVVGWQASSFYVDTAKALWELLAIWLLLDRDNIVGRWRWLVTSLFVGASLATKAFSWLLLPVFVHIIFQVQKKNKLRTALKFLATGFLFALPFYLRTWLLTGNPVLSIGLHLSKLGEIGGQAQLIPYLLQRAALLPVSLFSLIFFVQDYVSLLIIIFLPLVVLQFKELWRDTYFQNLLYFGIAQYLVWWFVPPLSTRYALSGFVVLLIVLIGAAAKKIEKSSNYYVPLVIAIIFAIGINLAPRLVVAKRNMEFIINRPGVESYLQQFNDGSIDHHLQNWYQLSR